MLKGVKLRGGWEVRYFDGRGGKKSSTFNAAYKTTGSIMGCEDSNFKST